MAFSLGSQIISLSLLAQVNPLQLTMSKNSL